MLSKLIIPFFPRSKHGSLMAAITICSDFGAQKIKSDTVSTVSPFYSCSSSFPASGSFQMSQIFAWDGQNIGVSASVSVVPMNTQDWSPFGLVGSPCSPRDSQESSPTHHSSKASIFRHSAFFTVQLSHPYMTTGKTIALTRWTFVGKVTSLLFNMLSRLVITFLPRSKHLLMCSVVSKSLQPYRLYPSRLFSPCCFPGKNIGVGFHFLHQGYSWSRDWTLTPALQENSLPLESLGKSMTQVVGEEIFELKTTLGGMNRLWDIAQWK